MAIKLIQNHFLILNRNRLNHFPETIFIVLNRYLLNSYLLLNDFFFLKDEIFTISLLYPFAKKRQRNEKDYV